LSTTQEECPYCSVLNETEQISISHQAWAALLGLFGYKGQKTKTVRSLRINCTFCRRVYTLLKFRDLDWIKERLSWDDSVRTGMLNIFGTNLSRDNIIYDITGIALRDDEKLDVCFKKGGKRAYMSCVKEGKSYKGVYMEEIVFG